MKKGMIYIMMANIICLVFNLLTNFVLPKYLSIDTYALIKTYALYITYAGFFSLGYNDGMYLKYGGISINKIDKKDLSNNYLNYLLLEFIMSILLLIIGAILKKYIIIAFSLGMFTTNVLGYLKSLYQATGEFSEYGKALRLEKKIKFINIGRVSLEQFRENICSGFVLMLGNFSSGLFTGLDRWFIKILMSSANFAFYSFAVSTESIINVFMTPITVSMYNYFCKENSIDKVKKIKSMLIVGIILNLVLYSIFKSMLSIAMGTLITSIIWLIICELGYKKLRFSIKEVIAIIIILISYLLLGFKIDAVYGFIIYCLVVNSI